MRIILLSCFLACSCCVAYTQQASYASLMAHFSGDAPQARDSLAKYRLHIAELAAQDQWSLLLRTDRIDTLQQVDLSHLGLETLPKVLRGADSLRTLRIDENSIRKLPKWLRHLPNLQRLEWNNNAIAGRKMRWPGLPHLVSLEIEGNGQRRLGSLRKSKQLQRLSLADNEFESLPIRALKRNDSLKELIVSHNKNLALGPDKYSQLSMLRDLKIHGCDIETYHPSLYEMSGLTDLQFVNNRLKVIPPGINQLQGLTKLSFYRNNLTALPAEIFELSSLEVIDLYYNQLTVIPPTISQWQHLQVLYLSNNLIYDLPETLGELTGLRELYLHHNRLSALPASTHQLTRIHTLRIDHNYLTEFPDQALALHQLGYLDISANDIVSLPRELGASFPDLYLFNYQETPLDFESPGQEFLAEMIHALIKKGVVCTPRVEMQVVEGNEE